MAGQGKKTSAERRRELAAQRKAAAAEARRKARMRAVAVTAAVVLAAGAVAGVIFGAMALFDDDDSTVATEATPTPEPTPTPAPAPAGKANCTYTPDGSTPSKDVGTPPSLANATGKYEATIQINNKPVVMELDAAAAPCAVNNFVYLAKAKYFDETKCHRELNSPGTYVLQCGDPDATGRGGPGYTFPDENLEGATYEAGVVAMANAGPNTNGSQFFMMFKDSDFQPDYVPFGKIISGLDVLTDIAKDGTKLSDTGSNDAPKNDVTINKVTITKEPKVAATPKPTGKATPKATSTADPSATPKATKTPKAKATASSEPTATSTP